MRDFWEEEEEEECRSNDEGVLGGGRGSLEMRRKR